MVGALEQVVHDRAMSRGRTGKLISLDAPTPQADGNAAGPIVYETPKPAAKDGKRRRRSTAEFEERRRRF